MKTKILLSLGSTASIAVPIATTVACDDASNTSSSSYRVDANAVIYDITNVKSTEVFINSILGTFNVKMPSPATELAPNTATRLKGVGAYLESANFHKDQIKLINGSSEYRLDFSEVHKWMTELLRVSKLPFSSFDTSVGLAVGLAAKDIVAIDAAKIFLSSVQTTNLQSFTNMYDLTGKVQTTLHVVTQEDLDN